MLDCPIYLQQSADISGNAVIGIVASQGGVYFADLVPDRIMSYSPHQLLQRHKAAPQARFLGAHPNLEVAFSVSRAIQREAQKVDCFRAVLRTIVYIPSC